jgi:hypothetical protein
VIVALVGLALAQASAAPAPQPPVKPVTVVGHGNNSCGKWTQAKASGGASRIYYEVWLGGFLSGINTAGQRVHGNVTDGTDFDGLTAWVDNYCAANPLETVFTAAENLVATLLKRKFPSLR